MATLKLAYVDRFRLRGRWRYYFRRRRDAKRIPLPGQPGDPAFMAAYEQACAATDYSVQKRAVVSGSIDALAASYYQSLAFMGLARSTQSTYRNILDNFRGTKGADGMVHGTRRIAHLTRRVVERIIADKVRSSGPHAANNLLRVLSYALEHAVGQDWIRANPALGVKPIKTKSTGFRTWEEEHIEAFENHYASGTRERLALCLILYTGQRRSDIVRMGRQHRVGDAIRVRQVKTDAMLTLPLHPALRRELDLLAPTNLTFLLTAFGKPFTAAGFGNWFRDVVDAVPGLKGQSLASHGLRKATARRLAEAGASLNQIMAVGGWKTAKEVVRYTAAADQRRLAREVVDKLGGE